MKYFALPVVWPRKELSLVFLMRLKYMILIVRCKMTLRPNFYITDTAKIFVE